MRVCGCWGMKEGCWYWGGGLEAEPFIVVSAGLMLCGQNVNWAREHATHSMTIEFDCCDCDCKEVLVAPLREE